MKSSASTLLVLLPVSLLVVLAGCAEGSSDVEASEDFLASSPLDAGPAQGEGMKIPPPSNPSSNDGEDTDAGMGSETDTDAGGNSDAGGGGGGGGTSCVATNNCAGATNLGTVKGDTGSDTQSAQGSTSQWFTVRVSEDDSGVGGNNLKLHATLTSPPGTNFDLFLYVPATDVKACSAVTHQSVSTAAVDTASAVWGENGLFSNDEADDRFVTVEVRHVSGPCDASKKWSLTVTGNQ
jgi:hypothetical protein